MNEPDVNRYNDDGHLILSATELYAVDSDDEADDLESTSADDVDDDSCLDADFDDEHQEELNELAALIQQYPDLPPADTQIIGIKSKKVPRNIVVTKQKTSGATANSSSNTRRNGRFKLNEVEESESYIVCAL